MGEQQIPDGLVGGLHQDQAIVSELKQSIQGMLNDPRLQAGVNALRVLDMFRHGRELFRLFPDYHLPHQVGTELNQVLEHKTEYALSDDEKRFLWEKRKEVEALRSGWLFTASYDTGSMDIDKKGPSFAFRAGHHIADVLPAEELAASFRLGKLASPHAVAEETFRGFFARLHHEDSDIYLLQLDGGKSRAKFDREFEKDRDHTIAMIVKGLQQKQDWLKEDGPKKKVLVISNHIFTVEHIAVIGTTATPTIDM
ncbi:hypothetical protein HY409_00310 [Candidatus Gottesmanbacteria bacterium]|nr:hypothetical protein [Candidatus Gottesmanbacteria bacterium]